MLGNKLQRLPAVPRAVLLGCLAEGILAGLNGLFGSAGMGGMNLMTMICALWHIPGMILMSLLPDSSARNAWGFISMFLVYLIGAMTFAALFYWFIRRREKAQR